MKIIRTVYHLCMKVHLFFFKITAVRPKRERWKGFADVKFKRTKMTCSRCRQVGHNRKTCSNYPVQKQWFRNVTFVIVLFWMLETRFVLLSAVVIIDIYKVWFRKKLSYIYHLFLLHMSKFNMTFIINTMFIHYKYTLNYAVIHKMFI